MSNYPTIRLENPETGEVVETVVPMPGTRLDLLMLKLAAHAIWQLTVIARNTRKPVQSDNISSGYTQQDMDDIRRI